MTVVNGMAYETLAAPLDRNNLLFIRPYLQEEMSGYGPWITVTLADQQQKAER